MSVDPAEKSALVPFNFEGEHVRVVQVEGQPWFVANDVAKILGLSGNGTLDRLDSDEKGSCSTGTLGGEQQVSIVSEAGFYKLALRCRKATKPGTPQHRFCKWVTGTVLPEIRATGSFRPMAETLDLTDSNVLRRLLLQECTKFQNRAKIAEATVEVTQPKADVYDRIANADGSFGLQQAAKILGQQPGKFIRDLKASCLFYRGSQLVPRQDFIDRGLLELKVHMIDDKARCQSLITPKGLAYFAKKLGVEVQRELFAKEVTA